MERGERVPMSVIPIKTIDRTGDEFVDSCFHFDLAEYDEVRDWSKIPEATALAKKGNEAVLAGEYGRFQEAIRLGTDLRSTYPDFDFCYAWLAHLYLQLNSFGEAHKAVADGLRLAKSKYRLCEKRASIISRLESSKKQSGGGYGLS